MSEEYGNDFISVTDEDGVEMELEHLDTIEIGDQVYMAFLPVGMDEDDDDYGMILLRVLEEDGEEILATIDDDAETEKVYNEFITRLFEDEE